METLARCTTNPYQKSVVQQNFLLETDKEELIESQMEKLFCIWIYEWKLNCCKGIFREKTCKSEWKLSCHKRIIREKDAKNFSHNNRTEVPQLIII